MRTAIATAKSQSARLLQCGVSADTADMSWRTTLCPGDDEPWAAPQLSVLPYSEAKDIYGDDYIEPVWSLSALLGLLPKEIDIDGYPYRISIYFENPDEPVIGNQWCLFYKPKKHNEKSHYIDDVPMYAPDLIECAVLMVEWLTENNYKLNEQ